MDQGVVMREREKCSLDRWGELLSKVLGHEITGFLSSANADTLSSDESVAMLYEELRPLVMLKSEVESIQPQSEALVEADAALLHFTKRLFLAAHQALLNSIEAENEKNHFEEDLSGELRDTRGFLMEWQLVRLRAGRERLLAGLAEVSERDQQLFRQLNLTCVIPADTESVRLDMHSPQTKQHSSGVSPSWP
jgi:hypothetical protein